MRAPAPRLLSPTRPRYVPTGGSFHAGLEASFGVAWPRSPEPRCCVIWAMGLVAMLIALFGPALVRVPPHRLRSAWRRRHADVHQATTDASRRSRRRPRRPVRGEAPRPTRRRRILEPEAWWVLALFGLPIAAWYYVLAGWWGALGGTAVVLLLATFGPGRLWWAWALAAVLVFVALSVFFAWWMALVGVAFVVVVLALGHLESQRVRRAARSRHDPQAEALR